MLSSDTEKRIVVEFVLSATEEIIQAAEAMMSDTSTFTETLSDGASTSLSSTLNKKVQVEASAPITLERVVGKKIVEEDMDGTSNVPEGDGGSTMPDWFLPVVITAGSLIVVLVIGGLIMQRRARNKLSKSIQPFNSDDLDDAKEISSRGDSDRKKRRGRDSGNFGDPVRKKSSPYKVATPDKATPSSSLSESVSGSGRKKQSPYSVPSPRTATKTEEDEKEEEEKNKQNKFRPGPSPSPSSPSSFKEEKSSSSSSSSSGSKTPGGRRALPPLRTKNKPLPSPGQAAARRGSLIGPGSPVALPSPSAVNRYRAFQAEKQKKTEKRRKEKEERAAREEKEAQENPGSTRKRSVSPGRLSKEEKSVMLDEYKMAHKKMYASVKERLKEQHLERLKKLVELKKEEERLRGGAPPSNEASSPGESKTEPVAAAAAAAATTTTKVAVDAASAGVGTVSAETRNKILDASPDKEEGPTRAEVLASYKAEHKRMRAQMKAKLKTEYMERLRRERALKSAKKGSSKIEGEGMSKD